MEKKKKKLGTCAQALCTFNKKKKKKLPSGTLVKFNSKVALAPENLYVIRRGVLSKIRPFKTRE